MKERKQFGKRIADFQNTQFTLADMATDLAASRSLLHTAARKLDAKAPDATKYCAMAKRFVTDAAFKVADQALQLHGGYGYLADYGLADPGPEPPTAIGRVGALRVAELVGAARSPVEPEAAVGSKRDVVGREPHQGVGSLLGRAQEWPP